MYKLLVLAFICFLFEAGAQNKDASSPVYVDPQGVMRWSNTKSEVALFGTNYTVPFAHAYRVIQQKGLNHKKIIDQDVYHFARLGFDAFRVHVWDIEITEKDGTLINNDHLDLFDYLIFKLKERNIKILLTPIAFWDNGYPDGKTTTSGFAGFYSKQKALLEDDAIKAQEKYVQQFLQHRNPYTNKTYIEDQDIIAMEINNEPHHSGSLEQTSSYINRMVKSIKNSGWNKPVFYNISESPAHAASVAKAPIDGVSFQWYPSGLVANHSRLENYLPHVDQYTIPFHDLKGYSSKARIVYEFDPADIPGSYLYPAMARSFRQAGMQWATQFAYDPISHANYNTEYQTHYVNLAYTPSKAISLKIAGEVFRKISRNKSFGIYPADTLFDVFRVSYHHDLSEMVSAEKFFYSNTTTSSPPSEEILKNIAGVGSSPLVQYEGKGAYFLDKIQEGVWRLEVMPDAVWLHDPFEKASLSREISAVLWKAWPMTIRLNEIGENYSVTALPSDQSKMEATGKTIEVKPGVYLIQNRNVPTAFDHNMLYQNIRLNEFVAPTDNSDGLFEVIHRPVSLQEEGQPLLIKADIISKTFPDKVEVVASIPGKRIPSIEMVRKSGYAYEALLPKEFSESGFIHYNIVLAYGDIKKTFPGNYNGHPWDWDYNHPEQYKTKVIPSESPIVIFDGSVDSKNLEVFKKSGPWCYIKPQIGDEGKTYASLLSAGTLNEGQNIFDLRFYVADKFNRIKHLADAKEKMMIRLKVAGKMKVAIGLVTQDGAMFEKVLEWDEHSDNTLLLSLSEFKHSPTRLLPNAYPGFMNSSIEIKTDKPFNLSEAVSLQFHILTDYPIEANKAIVNLAEIFFQ